MSTLTAETAGAVAAARPPSYAPAMRWLHWGIAILIFAAIGIALYAKVLPRSEWRLELMAVHKSLGLTVLALVVLRILARLALGAPAYLPPLDAFTRYASRLGHLALYALMLAMPISGYIDQAAGQRVVSWFGLFNVPTVIGPDKELSHSAAFAHYVFAWAIGAVLTIHIAAVLWHIFVKRDKILARMWPVAGRT